MVINNPFTDVAEAYRNRARIEDLRLKEAIRIRPELPKFEYPHYPTRKRR